MRIRPPAVSGMFYPDDPRALSGMIRAFLERIPAIRPDPPAFVAPHAGYVYSGFTAACAYGALTPTPRRVFIAAPSHRVAFEGVSLGNWEAFATPLGEIPVDLEMVTRMAEQPGVNRENAPHLLEHALEVHLPFLQVTLGRFTLVPMIYGRVAPATLARLLLDHRQEGDLVVISSDLSHFYSDIRARKTDAHCHQAMTARRPRDLDRCEACGGIGMAALLEMALTLDWEVLLADYRTSADTTGDLDRVVGYGSYLCYPMVGADHAPSH